MQELDAIYENGVLRPLEPLSDVPEHARVRVRVALPDRTRHVLSECVGIMPDEDAEEMLNIIETEFERVDPREWQ